MTTLYIDPNEKIISGTFYGALSLGIVFRSLAKLSVEVFIKPKPFILYFAMASLCAKSLLAVFAGYATITSSVLKSGKAKNQEIADWTFIDPNYKKFFNTLLVVLRNASILEVIAMRSRAVHALVVNHLVTVRVLEVAIVLFGVGHLVPDALTGWSQQYSDKSSGIYTLLVNVSNACNYGGNLTTIAGTVAAQSVFFYGMSVFMKQRIDSLGFKGMTKLLVPVLLFSLETAILIAAAGLSIMAFWNSAFDDISDIKYIAFSFILVDLCEFGQTMAELLGKSTQQSSNNGQNKTLSRQPLNSAIGHQTTPTRGTMGREKIEEEI
ncbi:hypothetical protein HK100_009068 [Physocladia obscura]|uniref:Uncharacterized protein n=1 Tax=Physocladia obscura TaxID=109957 RepID=A0AAD5SM82_9FUNG|nr:hypothetical protein HK100_009068 [Physocladia obscura]